MARSIDIVTLGNLEEKMGRWHPDNDNHLHALVDMGRFVSLGLTCMMCTN